MLACIDGKQHWPVYLARGVKCAVCRAWLSLKKGVPRAH